MGRLKLQIQRGELTLQELLREAGWSFWYAQKPMVGGRVVDTLAEYIQLDSERVAESAKTLKEFQTASKAELHKQYDEYVRGKVTLARDLEERRQKINASVQRMMKKVRAWDASEEMKELKDFVLAELEDSLETEPNVFTVWTREEWVKNREGYLRGEVDYYLSRIDGKVSAWEDYHKKIGALEKELEKLS